MFHVERNIKNHIIKGLAMICIPFFVFGCIAVKTNPVIADYHILNPIPNKLTEKSRDGVFIFENHHMSGSFQSFLVMKLNPTNKKENRDFKATIEETKFIISVLDQRELETYIDLTDVFIKSAKPGLVKTGNEKSYVAITVKTPNGEDCLKNNSLYQNIVLKYLINLKQEYKES